MLPEEKAAIGFVGEEEERKLSRTGGKEKSCKSDNKGRSEREYKDGPFVFPGGRLQELRNGGGIVSVRLWVVRMGTWKEQGR